MLTVRWLCRLAILLIVLRASPGQAQTVVVINAAPGTAIEFVLESAVVGTGTVDAKGTAVIQANESALGTRRLDGLVRVDNCGPAKRIVIFDRSQAPPPGGLCDRVEIAGLFLVQSRTSLVFDLGSPKPTMRVRQGAVPSEWVQGASDLPRTARVRDSVQPPTGLIVFGGAGAGHFRDFTLLQCGASIICGGDDSPALLNGGVSYWFLPYVGVAASYVKPHPITAWSAQDAFQFDSKMDPDVFTGALQGGVPVGPVRIVGTLGATYHRATLTINQTMVDATATVDGVTLPITGGSQTIQTQTAGWGWMWNGGAEWWVLRQLAIYGEYGQLTLKGSDRRGSEAAINERVDYFVFGAKWRVPLPF